MNFSLSTFNKHINGLGDLTIRPIQLPDDIEYIHQWVNMEYASFWGQLNSNFSDVLNFYRDLETGDVARSYIGTLDNNISFLVEVYNPEKDSVGEAYSAEAGDIGMHILIAPVEQPIKNFTFNIFSSVIEFLFTDDLNQRVVVEPDFRNHKIHALNIRAGFKHERQIQLGEKTAFLGFCTRQDFNQAMTKENFALKRPENSETLLASPALATANIHTNVWSKVNRQHIRKCIAELAHERVLEPKQVGETGSWNVFQLDADKEGVSYLFKAKLLELDHWLIDEDSIEKRIIDQVEPLDSVRFIIEFSKSLNIDPDKLPTYMEEITSTLCGAAFKVTKDWLSSKSLTQASFQEVETNMSEGHPSFIANNGRIGFDAIDYRNFAPESGSPVKLIYLAAHKRRAHFSSAHDYNYDNLFEGEIDVATRTKFNKVIKENGQNPEDYLFMPVHPWQWYNKLAVVYAPDIACGDLICLGYADDDYFAQQSIRTFFNISHPEKHYVKTALSVLNMGFMRGLSSYYMRTTPAINDWVNDLISGDEFLNEKGFQILREVAAIGYRNPYYESEEIKDSPYKKMLAALWRESPTKLVGENQRLMTMASLLHIDPDGTALLPELIASSGLSTDDWLAKYFDVYMTPLLHCYFQHSLVFMPHGENLILLLENNVPVKAIMKDIGEEVCLLNTDIELPEDVKRISIKMPEEIEILSIFTDVFDCIYRYISAILVEHSEFPEESFWKLVADCIKRYQTEHPQLQSRFEKHDLFASEFALSCLNRLQLGNNQQMIDLSDPAANLKFAGTLKNPIAKFK